jgi:hypothetical protein
MPPQEHHFPATRRRSSLRLGRLNGRQASWYRLWARLSLIWKKCASATAPAIYSNIARFCTKIYPPPESVLSLVQESFSLQKQLWVESKEKVVLQLPPQSSRGHCYL